MSTENPKGKVYSAIFAYDIAISETCIYCDASIVQKVYSGNTVTSESESILSAIEISINGTVYTFNYTGIDNEYKVELSPALQFFYGDEIYVEFITEAGTTVTGDIHTTITLSAYMTGADVWQSTQDKYGKMTDKALSDIINRKAWEYDIEDDEAYQAYRDMYTREGNRAMEDAIASAAGLTGGYTNSAALTAGGQAQNYYMQQLADRIPELQANDYNRYLNEQELRRQALSAILNTSGDYYNKLYQTAASDRADINNAFDANYARNTAEREWQDSHALTNQKRVLNDYMIKQSEAESAYYDDNAKIANETARANLVYTQITNQQTQIENAFANGRARGSFTKAECAVLGIPEGTSPYAAEEQYTRLQNSLELEKQKALSDMEYEQFIKQTEYETSAQAAIVAAEAQSKIDTELNKELLEGYTQKAQKLLEGENGVSAAEAYINGLGANDATKAAVAGYIGLPAKMEEAAKSEEYASAYNAVARRAREIGYSSPTEMAKDSIAFSILSLDISPETAGQLMNDFGVDEKSAQEAQKRIKRGA